MRDSGVFDHVHRRSGIGGVFGIGDHFFSGANVMTHASISPRADAVFRALAGESGSWRIRSWMCRLDSGRPSASFCFLRSGAVDVSKDFGET